MFGSHVASGSHIIQHIFPSSKSTTGQHWSRRMDKVKLLQYNSINDNRAAGEGYNEKKSAGK